MDVFGDFFLHCLTPLQRLSFGLGDFSFPKSDDNTNSDTQFRFVSVSVTIFIHIADIDADPDEG